jgi:mRNA interferase MazF
MAPTGHDMIYQGDIYWIELDEPIGSEPGYRYPFVVIQNNFFNHSRINTVVVCALTSNLKRANAPGNVKLKPKEGNLPKQCRQRLSDFHRRQKSVGRIHRYA